MSDIVLIGSLALNWYIPSFREKPRDVDLIMSMDRYRTWIKNQFDVTAAFPLSDNKFCVHFEDKPIHEIEIARPGSSGEMLIKRCSAVSIPGGYSAPSLNLLYTIKMSHRYLKNSPHFLKTREDIERLRGLGCRVLGAYEEFLALREKETYTYTHPKLNQTKKDFFSDDGVKYVYDHDALHEVVKLDMKPAYSFFKPLDRPVLVCKKMWLELPFDVQLNSVLEEAYVLALERSQIPFPSLLTPFESFKIALMKVCTSITSGWWREFAYDNYYIALARYSDDYFKKFKEAEKSDAIKLAVVN